MSAAPPQLIADRYRLIQPLGQGGMGRVWLARDEILHRDVAIKELVPPPGLTDDERREMRERSLREARAIARLNHVNVVRIFDVLRTDADPWIVMEYVPSRSLQDVLAADGPVTPARAIDIGLGVLGALRAAHRNGVVHRDVKPGNVLLGDDGRVVLTDFGLATVPGDPNVTRTGLVLGSPAYIAPERAKDGNNGPEADLWSLGATLYAAIEGASPYARASAIATLAALATEPPPVSKKAGPLKQVLAGLLRKDPEVRITAAEAERLLRRAAGRRPRLGLSLLEGARRPSPLGPREPRPPHVPAPRTPTDGSPVPVSPAPVSAGSPAAPVDPTPPGTSTPADATAVVQPSPPAQQPTPADRTAIVKAAPAEQTALVKQPQPADKTAVLKQGAAAAASAAGTRPAGEGDEPSWPTPPTEQNDRTGTEDRASQEDPATAASAAPTTGPEKSVEPETSGTAGASGTADTSIENDAPQPAPDEADPAAAVDEPGPIAHDPPVVAAPTPEQPAEPTTAGAKPAELTKALPGAGPAMVVGARPGVGVGTEPPQSGDRSKQRLWLIAAVAAIVVLLGAIAVPYLGDDAEPTGQASPTPSAGAPTSDAAASEAPPVSPEPAPTSAAPEPTPEPTGLGDPVVPDGWRLHRDPTGFSVPVPEGWRVSREASRVRFQEPVTGRLLMIDQTDRPEADPVADWKSKESYRRNTSRNYQRVGQIRAVDYWDKAADWEWTYTSGSGNRLHVRNRGFITAPDKAYAIYWSTLDSRWDDDLGTYFDVMAAGFRPVRS